jgi:hypothetical protein
MEFVMIKKRYRVFLVSLIVFSLTLACSLFTGGKTEPELPVLATRVKPPTQAPESTVRSTESSIPANVLPTARPGEIRQWAISARASSQYGDPNWAASQAIGEPNVFDCGDNTNAWASLANDTVDWIELTFNTPVVPSEINIYQSFNPSQVVEVQMIATDGSKTVAWEGYPEAVENCPDVMSIYDLTKNVMVNKVRITIDQRVNGWGWNEIDAVELVGSSK